MIGKKKWDLFGQEFVRLGRRDPAQLGAALLGVGGLFAPPYSWLHFWVFLQIVQKVVIAQILWGVFSGNLLLA